MIQIILALQLAVSDDHVTRVRSARANTIIAFGVECDDGMNVAVRMGCHRLRYCSRRCRGRCYSRYVVVVIVIVVVVVDL